jgi:riboflavin synthase
MFTGLIERLGEIVELLEQPPGKRLRVNARELARETRIGDSVAVNGCCLTVVRVDGEILNFEAGEETLSRTNLGLQTAGQEVNLERSLRASDRLGGHFVTGHVDAIGKLAERRDDVDWSYMWFAFPEYLSRQIASKGSIAVDGVSLTVVDVEKERFSVALIPHTLRMTTLGKLSLGASVNLETDLLAKYVERQIAPTVVT